MCVQLMLVTVTVYQQQGTHALRQAHLELQVFYSGSVPAGRVLPHASTRLHHSRQKNVKLLE